MELSKRAQAVIAIISGAILAFLLISAFTQGNINRPTQESSDKSSLANKFENKNEDKAQVNGKQVNKENTNDKKAEESKVSGTTDNKQSDSQANDYFYTAEAGDSYSLLARQAIQEQLKKDNRKLSPAQIIAAESFLSIKAQSPELNIGEKVTIENSDIVEAINRAEKLSPSEISNWELYVPYVML